MQSYLKAVMGSIEAAILVRRAWSSGFSPGLFLIDRRTATLKPELHALAEVYAIGRAMGYYDDAHFSAE